MEIKFFDLNFKIDGKNNDKIEIRNYDRILEVQAFKIGIYKRKI